MRIARVALAPGNSAFVEVDGERGHVLDAAPWLGGKRTGVVVPWRERPSLAPVDPPKILAIGRNYRAHAAELGNEVPKEPLLFMKPSSALIGDGGTIVLPRASAKIEHEAELAVVIGRRARDVSVAEAMSIVFGYTCANDVTARDLQRSDGQWARAKGFDTFCPLGPWIETDLDPAGQRIVTRLDGEVVQDGPTSDMVHDTAALISFASKAFTLLPGDVILTGTPAGVGLVEPGQRVEVEVDGIGVLSNPFVRH